MKKIARKIKLTEKGQPYFFLLFIGTYELFYYCGPLSKTYSLTNRHFPVIAARIICRLFSKADNAEGPLMVLFLCSVYWAIISIGEVLSEWLWMITLEHHFQRFSLFRYGALYFIHARVYNVLFRNTISRIRFQLFHKY